MVECIPLFHGWSTKGLLVHRDRKVVDSYQGTDLFDACTKFWMCSSCNVVCRRNFLVITK